MFGDSRTIGTDRAKFFCTDKGAKTFTDFLLDFEHPYVPLGLVVVKGIREAYQKSKTTAAQFQGDCNRQTVQNAPMLMLASVVRLNASTVASHFICTPKTNVFLLHSIRGYAADLVERFNRTLNLR